MRVVIGKVKDTKEFLESGPSDFNPDRARMGAAPVRMSTVPAVMIAPHHDTEVAGITNLQLSTEAVGAISAATQEDTGNG